MNNLVIGILEQRLIAGKISEAEYRKRKAQYVDSLYELYVRDIITYEELQEKLNQ